MDGIYVDDVVVFFCFEYFVYVGVGGQESVIEVNGEYFFLVVESEIDYWCDDLDIGIVDQYIDVVKCFDGCCDVFFDLCFVVDIYG